MLKINYSRVDFPQLFNRANDSLNRIRKSPAPSFETTKTDLKFLTSQVAKFKKFKNIILIANGGSRTSARAFYHGLADFRNKVGLKFLTSAEPRLINNLRKNFKKSNTLVLVISKSGDNINNIEPLMFFLDYKVLAVTGSQPSTLRSIAEKRKWPIIEHPEVGGRFSGLTACGLVPAALLGLDIKKITQGAETAYKKYSRSAKPEDNDALKLALYLADLGNKGFSEIFASIYSSSLVALLPLMIQLFHETYSKAGHGQTIFGDYSPESQHHTNQRFFGGPHNVIGLLLSEEKMEKDIKLNIPANLKKISFRGHELGQLNGLTSSQTLAFDRGGVLGHCREAKIPTAEISVDKITPESFAELMVFWQYYAIYAAELRGINPFDQPEVEFSKKIGLELRVNRQAAKK